jgi:23S rRNA (cytosine1962-C5)-methyltransferase
MQRSNNRPNNRHSNYGNSHSRVPSYEIHPTSVKMINQGNPWVTLDEYSEKFQPKEKFIIATNDRKPFALLLHDPQHKIIRARLWAKGGNLERQAKSFKTDCTNRIDAAFRLRKSTKIMEKRNNFYLVFGEADQLPGLFIQYLNGEILIQHYTYFWSKFENYILEMIMKKMKDVFSMDVYKSQIWKQMRVDTDAHKAGAVCLDPNISFKNLEVTEYGVNYKLNLGSNYDVGLYTDMSSVREKMKPLFEKAKSVLNLYSYTGAFSLFALKNGAENVTSVDLSEKYLEWLDENLKLNADFNPESHTSMAMSAKDAMNELYESGKKFDLIICDPPSSSSDGNKRTNALSDYGSTLSQINSLLSEYGKAVVFLNTHKVNRKKFQFKLHDIIKSKGLKLKASTYYGLNDDCPAMPRFPEGSYLKGFLIEKCEKPLEEIERSQKASGGANNKKPSGKKPYRKNFNKKPVNGNR